MTATRSIPYGRQTVTDSDVDAVSRVLRADFLTQGPEIDLFEKDFAAFVGSEYAVAVSNGTAALHLCALALGVEAGQKVITSPITFAASANCVLYCGGEVVFADIDPETALLDIESVRALLAASPKGTYAGIIPVDMAGMPVQMDAFRELADEYGCWIIEDACHAPGGKYSDVSGEQNFCGNGKYADLAIFSFHPVKHIACGEGGMITTNDKALFEKLVMLRTHGITKSPDLLQENHGGWYYEMQELGYNYRLSDIQAALGRSQMARLDENLAQRRALASRYFKAFENGPVTPLKEHKGNAYHLFVIQAENRKGLYDHLRSNGIYAQVHYIPVHTLPYYQSLGWKKGQMPAAENYYERCLSLPLFHGLSDDDQDYVIDTIFEFYGAKKP